MQDSCITISKKVLLYPYYPAFLIFIIVMVDVLVFNGALKSILPTSLSGVFLFITLFEFPHIIASFFMLGDSEYRSTYKKVLVKNMYLFAGAVFVLTLVSVRLFFFLYIVYTLYHVVRQQFGISKFYGFEKSRFLDLYQVLFIGMGSMALLSFQIDIPQMALMIAGGTITTLTAIYFLYEKNNRKNIYLSLCVVSFCLAGIIFGLGYMVLGYLIVRITHDITAFIFYSVHNYNRKRESDNPLYTSVLTRRISPLVVTSLLAIVLNGVYLYAMKTIPDYSLAYTVLLTLYFCLGLFHYNLEGSVWKKDSLARKYIHVA